MHVRRFLIALPLALCVVAQDQPAPNPPAPDPVAQDTIARPLAPNPDGFVVPTGTKVPLSMINSVSTKTASEGDRIYLETVFPILANGRVAIPPGSFVAATVTEIKR